MPSASLSQPSVETPARAKIPTGTDLCLCLFRESDMPSKLFRAILILLVCATPAVAKPASSPFGINGACWSHLGANTDEFDWDTGVRRLDALEQMGASWDRCDFWWHRIEPEKGRFVWRDYDRVVDEYVRRGLHIMPILCYDAAWHPEQSPNTQEYREEYGRFVYETVKHFKGRISACEIWNEPNLSMYWRKNPSAEDYTELLKVAYREAKRADPNVIVVGGAVAGIDRSFIDGILRAGAGKHMDALSIHPYQGNLGSVGPEEGNLVEDIKQLRLLMARYSVTRLPIWITEMGNRTVPDPAVAKGRPQPTGRVSDDEQANYLVRSFLLAQRVDVKRVFWFNLQDWALETWGTISAEFRKKPSWYAFRTMARFLTNGTYKGAILTPERVHLLNYDTPDGPITAAWTDGPPVTIGLRGLSRTPTVFSPGGPESKATTQSHKLAVADGHASLALTQVPIYVRGISKAWATASPLVVSTSRRMASGAVLQLSPLRGQATALQACRRIQPTVTLEKESSTTALAVLEKVGTGYRLPTGLEPGRYAVRVRYPVPNGTSWSAVLPLEIVPPVRISVQPYPVNGRDALVKVENNSDRPTRFRIFASVTDAYESLLETAIPSGGVEVMPVRSLQEPPTSLARPVELHVDVSGTAGSASWTGPLYFLTAKKDSFGPYVVLSDKAFWQSQDGDWTGPEDLSVRLAVAWTDTALKIRAVVEDDVFQQNRTDGEVWREDSFQIAIEPDGRRRPDASGAVEFGLALTPEGPQIHRWFGGPVGPIPGAHLEVNREGNQIRYFASLPLRELGLDKTPHPRTIGFSFIYNDCDGTGREGWMAYGGGIAFAKRADQYGMLTLLPR